MLDDPPLLTIQARFTRPDPAKVAALRGAQTSHLVDAMDGRGALDWTIKPMDPGNARFAGVAVTCHAYPADNLAMFGAMEIAQAGDVIVCANDSYKVTAVIGDLVAGMMKNAGIEAFVTDGLGRDRAGIIATGLPLFCAGIVPNSPAKNGPGSVGLPITVAGVPVSAGDVIVGDADGVVVVPQAILDSTIARLAEVRAAEARAEAAVKAGSRMSESAAALLKSPRVARL